MKRYCLLLDVKDDPVMIQEYENYHKEVWPEILKSISDSGIERMEVFRLGTRLCMTVETTESFSFEKKEELDKSNPVVQEWEALMSKYQQQLPNAKPGEKWMLMNRIFSSDPEQ